MDWDQVRLELVRRIKIDQAVRKEELLTPEDISDNYERTKEIDADNTAYLKQIIADAKQLPTVELVGESAAYSAWLLIRHADLDVDFQIECLEMMKRDGADIKEIAYLTDRVMLNVALFKEKKSNEDAWQNQEYYTQWLYPSTGGLYIPYGVDWDAVFEKREAIGITKDRLPKGVLDALKKANIVSATESIPPVDMKQEEKDRTE